MNAKRNTLLILLAIFLMGTSLPGVSSAAVSVSAECAYTDADLVCYIYADTGGDQLRSGGVKLGYNSAEVTNPVATKNDTDWYFADTTGTTYPYMNPDTSIVGEVVYIVGKLDGAFPAEGAIGSRVKIGRVTFDRIPAAPIPTISLEFGRAPSYVNFVNVAGTNLDAIPNEVVFSATVLVRGDANASGTITSRDLTALRALLRNSSDYVVYADCNASGTLTSRDLTCLRAILRP